MLRKTAIVGIGVMVFGLFFVSLVPVWGGELEEEVRELRKEVTVLKQELREVKKLLGLVEDDILYLREKAVLPQGFLGIYLSDLPGGKGVVIEDIVYGSAAQKVGLEKGDIILSYGGVPIKIMLWLSDLIYRTRPGTYIEIVISRAGEKRIFLVQIGERETP